MSTNPSQPKQKPDEFVLEYVFLSLLKYGASLQAMKRSDTYSTVGGVVKKKTRGDKNRDNARWEGFMGAIKALGAWGLHEQMERATWAQAIQEGRIAAVDTYSQAKQDEDIETAKRAFMREVGA